MRSEAHFFPSATGLALAFLALTLPARATVRLPAIFSDHMVLQRSIVTPIWGWADPGEAVKISIAGQEAAATADKNGRWKTALNLSAAAAGPSAAKVSGAKNEIEIADVLIGEVWLAAGQSNMLYRLHKTIDGPTEVDKSTNPELREFFVAENPTNKPQEDCQGQWLLSNPTNAPLFAGVAYYFAKALQHTLSVPVGFVVASSGGTMGEAWSSMEALSRDPDLKAGAVANLLEAQTFQQRQAEYARGFAAWIAQTKREDHPADPQAFAATDASVTGWKPVKVPGKVAQKNGAFWLRTDVTLDSDDLTGPLDLDLECYSGYPTIYWNGTKIGETTYQAYPGRNYPIALTVPANLLKAGRNVIAIRVYSPKDPIVVTGKAKKMRANDHHLAGDWLTKTEYEFPTAPEGAPKPYNYLEAKSRAASLFNGMINPIIPYGIAGIIWYQGESNSKRAWQYRAVLGNLISDYRQRWGNPNLPFFLCQLPRYGDPGDDNNVWAELRDSQSHVVANTPHTAIASLIDLGEEGEMHPRDKKDPGERLAQIALDQVYGKNAPWSGPVFDAMKIDGSQVMVSFQHTDGGLIAHSIPVTYQPSSLSPATKPTIRNSPQSEIEGFALCGSDHQWKWADAKIKGDQVIVSSPAVPNPVAVRYAWSNFPTCNLFNGAGLPAAPFRSDDFPLSTANLKYGLTNPESEEQ